MTDLDQDLDSIVFNTHGHTPESIKDRDSNFVNVEGFYHLLITKIERKEEAGKAPGIRLTMEVGEGTDKSQIGKLLFHWIYTGTKDGGPPSETTTKSMLRFVGPEGLGLVSASDIGKPDLRIPWSKARGLQCIGEVRKEEDKTGKYKPSYKIPFGRVFQVNDPAVAEIPKNQEWLAAIGGVLSPLPPAAQPPKTDDLSDI